MIIRNCVLPTQNRQMTPTQSRQDGIEAQWTALRGTTIFVYRMSSQVRIDTAVYLSTKCGATTLVVNTDEEMEEVVRRYSTVAKDCIVLISHSGRQHTGEKLAAIYNRAASKADADIWWKNTVHETWLLYTMQDATKMDCAPWQAWAESKKPA